MENNKTNSCYTETVRSEYFTAGLVTYRIIIPIIKHIFIFIGFLFFVLLSIVIPFVGVPVAIIIAAVGLVRLALDIVMLFSYISEEIRVTDKGVEGKAALFRSFCLSFNDVEKVVYGRKRILLTVKPSANNGKKKAYAVFNVKNYSEIIDAFNMRAAVAANNTEKEEQTEEQ